MKLVLVAACLLACSTSSGTDGGVDAASDCAWNALIPMTTQYLCDGSVEDAAGCIGDPSTHSGGDVHPLGCEAITTQTSGFDERCQQMQCGCLPLACYCQTFIADAGPQWVCPD